MRQLGVRFLRHVPRASGTIAMRPFSDTQCEIPVDIQWEIDRHEFDEMMASRKESGPGPAGIPYSLHRCAGGLGSHILCINGCLKVLRCKQDRFHSQILRGQWQWSADDRQHLQDLVHVACAPQESGILLTDFAAAFTSVNHSWIFHVLEKAELPRFICRFLQSIYTASNTEVEFARKTRGHFCKATYLLVPRDFRAWNINTVVAKRFRCAEVLVMTRHAQSKFAALDLTVLHEY